jgi:hypothetical protein
MSYEIADEPTPSESLGNLVYEPTAPLLALMMCGAWLAWPWFIVNSIAMGSPTRDREIKLCVLALAGSIGLALAVFGLVDLGVIESQLALQIAILGVTSWKLGMAYLIANVQGRTFHVYTYYGGNVQNAFYILTTGTYVSSFVLDAWQNPIWRVVLSGVV